MATATRKSVVTEEKNDVTATAEMNGWNVVFNYKSIGDAKPTELNVTGNKIGNTVQSFSYRNGLGETLQFMGGASMLDNFDLVKSVFDELTLIVG